MLFESPPMATGTDAQKLSQVYSYLYQLSEQLNATLNNLTIENFSTEVAQRIEQAASSEEQKKDQAEQANTLKALIIKTADTVRSEMDQLELELRSTYVAQSEFGEFREGMKADIEATAAGVVQSFGYSSDILALQEGMVNFEDYRVEAESYIKTGLLYFDDYGAPVYGVAVGEKFAKVIVDGKEVLVRSGAMTTMTPGRISFWQGKTEVAYITGGLLHIPKAELSDHLVVGNYIIKRMRDGGLAIMVNRTEVAE